MTPGTKVGAYEILAPIGAGGMAETHHATEQSLLPRGRYQDAGAALAADAWRITKKQSTWSYSRLL